MPSLRLQRVRELLKREIGEVLRRELPVGDAGLITVNDVAVSGDLHAATVYVSILGKPEQQKNALQMLQKNRKRIRGLVGRAVILKYTPELRFVVDESIEKGNRVLKILEELDKTAGKLDEGIPQDH